MKTIADSYIEEGISKGITIGKNEGIAIGKNEGIAIGKNEGIAIGKNEGIAIGEARGEARGVEKRSLEIAKRLLKEKTDIKFIASVTGLSSDSILKLQNTL